MRAYVTRRCLAKGEIIVVDGEINAEYTKMFIAREPARYFHGNDWHETEAEAFSRAEEVRRKKIASLKASIAKLEKLTFKVVQG